MPFVNVDFIIRLALSVLSASFFAIAWLFFDALRLRFEVKSFFKLVGFVLLAIGFGSELVKPGVVDIVPLLIWLRILGFYLILAAFALDPHSKLQIGLILGIVALIFSQNHLSLMILSLMIALIVVQLSYSTQHKDLIPFSTGFILISIAEFFRSIEKVDPGQFHLASGFVYFFASLVLIFWLWSYLVIRFNLPAGRQGLKRFKR